MKNTQKREIKPSRGVPASMFFKMLAMLSITQALEKSENPDTSAPQKGFGGSGISGWSFYPNRHPLKSYARQRREAQKRSNIKARSKH